MVAVYAEALAARGHQVTLVSVAPPPVSFKQKVKSLLRGNGWPLTNPSKPSHVDGLGLEHRIVKHLEVPGNETVPDGDVVIATWWETAEWVDDLADSKGAKVYFVQGHEVFSHLPVARSSATYRLPLHKIVVAQWLREIMLTEYGDASVDVVPNSVDHKLFFANPREKQKTPTIGFLFSNTVLKGVDVVLSAVELLSHQFGELRLISFGTATPDWDESLRSKIEFHLSPPQESIRDLYAQCDVWLAASRSEGFNLPAMEAMACRTPVVSTKTGWPEEAIVNGHNGALVDVDDVEALAREAGKVLSLNETQWRLMSQNAYRTVADSSWEASADLFEAVLERLVGERDCGGRL